MSASIKKLALFGGTFDPIHVGHIRLAQKFAQRLELDRVLLMPTHEPPHKLKPEMAPAQARLDMCRIAAQASPLLEVSDWEIRRGGASFTADTLEWLHGEYPQAQLYLITGADMFLTLGTWWRFPVIAQLAVLCTAPRDGVNTAQLEAYARELEAHGAHCDVADISELPVSSTVIRDHLRAGESTAGWLPDGVEAYIQRHALYTADTEEKRDMEDQFIDILRKRLTPRRLEHSLAVADEAQRLAEKYGANVEKARTAGLLHDIMKDAGAQAQLQMFREFGILLSDVEQQAPPLWHAMAGAAFIERVLGLQDTELLHAVRYHTTGRTGMSLLEKVIFLADFASRDREYPDVETVRALVDTDLNAALRYTLTYSIQELLREQKAVHPDTLGAYNEAMLAVPPDTAP